MRVALLTAVILAALGGLATSAGATSPGRAGLLAVVFRGDANTSRLGLIDPGSGWTGFPAICSPACTDAYPAWAPGGAQLLFSRVTDTAPRRAGLWRTGIPFAAASALPKPRRVRVAFAPSFSPDGKRVVFTGVYPSGRPELFTANRDGTRARRFTLARGTTPSWSSRGRIAFSRPGPDIVVTVRRDGRSLRLAARHAFQPDWSPRGIYLAVTIATPRKSHARIAVLRPGGRPRYVTGGRNDRDPAWSPDGRALAFTRRGGVYVIGMARGARPIRGSLRLLCRSCAEPSWQPLPLR